jgi:hypothetical protein
MSTRTAHRLLLGILLVALATVMRIVPHPWNLTPVGAVALFSGACFDRKRWSFFVPLVAMFIGDTVIGYHSLMPAIYATFALIVCIGFLLREKRDSPAAVAAGAVASSTIFYLVTNFAVWRTLGTYPQTLSGLMACYLAGIPFYGTMLAGDVLYSALLFATFVWAERRIPQLAPQ